MSTLKAALFDLDGVIIDTEGQYSQFWGSIGREYLPHVPDFAERIKGTTLFDRILTSAHYAAGKPAPDCYLKGAEVFGAKPAECAVFEDSINGLRAGRDSGAFVVALTTTNPHAAVAPLADLVAEDLAALTLPTLLKHF